MIAYHLIIDNKRISEGAFEMRYFFRKLILILFLLTAQNRVQINDFFVASSPPTTSFFMDMNLNPINANSAMNANNHCQAPFIPGAIEAASNQASAREHPERMPQLRDMTATLDPMEQKQSSLHGEPETKKPTKKAKWHLGIRSQSKPQDIMNEVFKAMKTSNMVRFIFFSNTEKKFKIFKNLNYLSNGNITTLACSICA